MFKPVVATEIEFYLHGADEKFSPEQVVSYLRDLCSGTGLALYSAGQEKGRNQYEIALQPSYDKSVIAANTERFKVLCKDVFFAHGVMADFSAKPLLQEPGSGLHIHIHLEDQQGRNIFFREEDQFSSHLLHAVGGLLKRMNYSMLVFAPSEASYLRFSEKSNAPTTVSWGTNNRTVAIRLPNKPLDHKHIEHRVAGSDAVIEEVIDAVIEGVFYGIEHQCDPGEAIYGDACLPQYKLPLLAKTLEEARNFRLNPAN